MVLNGFILVWFPERIWCQLAERLLDYIQQLMNLNLTHNFWYTCSHVKLGWLKAFWLAWTFLIVSVTVRLFACPTVHGVSVNVAVCGFVLFWLHISSVSNILSWYYFLIFTSFSWDLDLTSRSQQYMALKYTVVFWASSDLFMFILYMLLNYMSQVVLTDDKTPVLLFPWTLCKPSLCMAVTSIQLCSFVLGLSMTCFKVRGA